MPSLQQLSGNSLSDISRCAGDKYLHSFFFLKIKNASGRRRRSYPDQFLVYNLLNAKTGKLLAVPGTLDATEGKIRGAHRWIVDQHHTGLDAAGYLLAVFNVR